MGLGKTGQGAGRDTLHPRYLKTACNLLSLWVARFVILSRAAPPQDGSGGDVATARLRCRPCVVSCNAVHKLSGPEELVGRV